MKEPRRAQFPNPDWQRREVGGRELKRPSGQVSADWPLGRLAPRGPLTTPSLRRADRKAAGSKGRGRGAGRARDRDRRSADSHCARGEGGSRLKGLLPAQVRGPAGVGVGLELLLRGCPSSFPRRRPRADLTLC